MPRGSRVARATAVMKPVIKPNLVMEAGYTETPENPVFRGLCPCPGTITRIVIKIDKALDKDVREVPVMVAVRRGQSVAGAAIKANVGVTEYRDPIPIAVGCEVEIRVHESYVGRVEGIWVGLLMELEEHA